MLSSITPLGERAKNNRWALTATFYIAGSALGGAVLGLVLSPLSILASSLEPSTVLGVLSLVLIGAAVLDATGIPRPSLPRQVDENWLVAYRGWVYGAGFGIQLGFGLVTIITSWSTWAVVAAVALAPADLASPLAGAVAVGATFGVARGMVLLFARTATDADRLAALHRRIAEGARITSRATIWSLAALGTAGMAAALATGGTT